VPPLLELASASFPVLFQATTVPRCLTCSETTPSGLGGAIILADFAIPSLPGAGCVEVCGGLGGDH